MSARPHHTSPAPWFNNAIVTGMQMLYTLQLPRTPGADVMPLTTITWVTALWRMPRMWDAERDVPRLEEAFISLAGVATEWPAARHLLDHLPPVPPPLALAPPPMERMSSENHARFQRLRAELVDIQARMSSRPVRQGLNRPLTDAELAQYAQQTATAPANAEAAPHPEAGGSLTANPHGRCGNLAPGSSHVAGDAGEGAGR